MTSDLDLRGVWVRRKSQRRSTSTQSPSRSSTTAYQAAVSTQVASAPPCRYSGSSLPTASAGVLQAQDGGAVLEAVQREADRRVQPGRREREQLGLGHAVTAAANRLRRRLSVSIRTAPASVSEIPAANAPNATQRQARARECSRGLAPRGAPTTSAATIHEHRGDHEGEEGVVAIAE